MLHKVQHQKSGTLTLKKHLPHDERNQRLDVWLREDVGECVAPREGQVLHILTLTNPPGPFSDFPRTF